MRLTWIERLCVVAIVVATAELRSSERGARLAALTAATSAGTAAVTRLAASSRSQRGDGSTPEGPAGASLGSRPFRR